MNSTPKWIPITLALFILLVVALVVFIPTAGNAEGVEEEYYGVLQDDSDSYNLDFDPDLVKDIQKALNKWLRKRGANTISQDGVFGPRTGQAVKLFQYKNGLTIDGICGPQTLRKLGIDPTGITAYPRWVPNLEESFAKSKTDYAIHLNLGSNKLEIYHRVDGEWRLIRVILAATGNYTKGNFTDLADELLSGTKHHYISGTSGGKAWRGYNATLIKNGDFIHSKLAHRVRGQWVFDDDSCFGKYVTHGCVRVSVENSEWIYQNMMKGTACVVDDRAWDFPVTH